MNEINSVQNFKNKTKKNLILKKVKNLKRNFHEGNYNKYNNIFHSNYFSSNQSSNISKDKLTNKKQKNQGKTAKPSPINFHNKIIEYSKLNKTNKIQNLNRTQDLKNLIKENKKNRVEILKKILQKH